MEGIIVFLLAVVALGVLADRLGCDTRPGSCSPEQAYSQLGLTWGDADSTLGGRPQHRMERPKPACDAATAVVGVQAGQPGRLELHPVLCARRMSGRGERA